MVLFAQSKTAATSMGFPMDCDCAVLRKSQHMQLPTTSSEVNEKKEKYFL